jgi:kexin
LDLYERGTLVRPIFFNVPHCSVTDCNRGEKGVGTWTVVVRDTKVDTNKGTFIDWHLKLWGQTIDASKAKLLPMPTEHDDDNHDEISTTTILPGTTTVPAGSDATNTAVHPTDLPSDHPQRPQKPTGTDGLPVATGTTDDQTAETSAASSWVPSFLPTFGASPHTLAWVYGSLGLIALFVCGLGAWWWIVRRRRLRNSPRDAYEFELLNEEEGEGLAGGAEPKRRRGGELYDAFAGGSDDEEEDRAAARRSTDSDGSEVVDEKQSSRLLGR